MRQTLLQVATPQAWLLLMEQMLGAQNTQDNYSAVAIWTGAAPQTTLLREQSDTASFSPGD